MQQLRQIALHVMSCAQDSRSETLGTCTAVTFHDNTLEPEKARAIVLRRPQIAAQLPQ